MSFSPPRQKTVRSTRVVDCDVAHDTELGTSVTVAKLSGPAHRFPLPFALVFAFGSGSFLALPGDLKNEVMAGCWEPSAGTPFNHGIHSPLSSPQDQSYGRPWSDVLLSADPRPSCSSSSPPLLPRPNAHSLPFSVY
jgi:hypothetical protein